MGSSIPASDWTVAETFTRCPETASVFHRFGMACAGCSMARFETLQEAADAYGLDVQALLAECIVILDLQTKDEVSREPKEPRRSQ